MQKTKAKANNTGVRAKLAWITLQCLRIFIFQCLTLIKGIVTRLCVVNCETYKELTCYFTIS